MLQLNKISGGEFSDWVSGTSEYVVPTGYTAYAFQPGSSGATINTAEWLVGNTSTETTVTDAYRSKWIDRSVSVGPIVFDRPVTSITLSAGDGIIFCEKNSNNAS